MRATPSHSRQQIKSLGGDEACDEAKTVMGWLEKGGFEKDKPERCAIASTFSALTAFCTSHNGGALKQVPNSLMCAVHLSTPALDRSTPLTPARVLAYASLDDAQPSVGGARR